MFPKVRSMNEPVEKLPPVVADSLKRFTAAKFGIKPQTLQIADVKQGGWSDGCLGLSEEEACTMALVSGWIVTLTNEQYCWVYHTAGVGNFRLNRGVSNVPDNFSNL